MTHADEIRIDAWFASAPEVVFDAWVDPVQLAAWFAAGDWQVIRVVFQPIAGSRWQIDFRHPNGSEYSETGTLIDVRHAERLEFTLTQTGLDLPLLETCVIVMFEAENAGTRGTFLQTGFGGDQTRRNNNHWGWTTCFTKLRLLIDASTDHADRE